MNEVPANAAPAQEPSARRRRQWFSWVWVVPLIALAIVVWLGVRALAERGPLITISFSDAEGLQAGDTRIRHKDVDLGTVEAIYLNPEMSRVFVRARMRRSVTSRLTDNARFWIVRPRVGIGGISGLSTLVSGAYIEMYPGAGAGHEQRQFVGLDDPPALTPDTPGRAFTLHAQDLGSLSAGSPVSYHGVAVGEIEGFRFDPGGGQIEVYAFVHSPYDRYVTAQTRFWNSGGIDVAVGLQGLRFRASSWQQLISGGVSFDTPGSASHEPESAANTAFRLYDNQYASEQDPRGATLTYRVRFAGGAGAVGIGTSVLLEGAEIGTVTESHLLYDDVSDALESRVTIAIDPRRVQIVPVPAASGADPAAALGARIARLVAHGLRARLITANFLIGSKVVALERVSGAPPAHIAQIDGIAELPSAGTTDVAALLDSAQRILHHIDAATAGPELAHAIRSLDQVLGHMDDLTQAVEPQVVPLMTSLREAADAAQRTLRAAHGLLGAGTASDLDLPRLIRELTESARSLRDLADYLERHPESLIRGRRVQQRVEQESGRP